MGFDAAYEVLGEKVQYKTMDLYAIVSDVTYTEDLLDGGVRQDRGVKIVIKDTQGWTPAVGDVVFYGAEGYRVIEVSKDILAYELTCETNSK